MLKERRLLKLNIKARDQSKPPTHSNRDMDEAAKALIPIDCLIKTLIRL